MSLKAFRSVLIVAGALALYAVARFIASPGLDVAASAVIGGRSTGLLGLVNHSLPLISIVSVPLVGLLVVRGLVALVSPEGPKRAATLIGFAVYLFFALGFAAYVLRVVYNMGPALRHLTGDLIESPALIRLTLVAGAAFTWGLATIISRTGACHGPLALVGLAQIGAVLDRIFRAATSIGHHFPAPEVVVLGAVGLVLCVSTFRRVRPGSHLLGGIVVLSGADLVLAPLAGAESGGLLAAFPSSIVIPSDYTDWFDALRWLPAAGACVAAAVTIVVMARKGERRRFAVTPGVLVLGLAGATLFLFYGNPFSRRDPQASPFRGTERVEVTLRSETGDAHADAPRLIARLAALEVEGKILEADAGRIRLRLSGAARVAELLAKITTPNRLGLYPAAQDQSPLVRAARTAGDTRLIVAKQYDPTDPTGEREVEYVRGPAEAMSVLLRTLSLPEGVWVAVDCSAPAEDEAEGARPHCTPRLLERTSILTGADIESAEVGFDPYTMRPEVNLRIAGERVQAFHDATERLVHRRVAIVLDQRIVTAPIVESALRSRIRITLGRVPVDHWMQVAEAKSLAAALSTGALTGPWTVESTR